MKHFLINLEGGGHLLLLIECLTFAFETYQSRRFKRVDSVTVSPQTEIEGGLASS